MQNLRKILLIGIDGGCWALLNRAIEAGVMPGLKEMVAQGSAGSLVSTIPPKTPAAWGTFQTGMNPGANGIFDFAWWDRQTHQTRYVSAASIHDTIWDLAGRAGKRVCAINVPITYPPKPVEGKLVTGILTPSLDCEWTYPSSLKEELLQAVPEYHIFNLQNIQKEKVHEDPSAFLQRMMDILENRTRAAQFLLEQDPYDLFMVHFQASDVVQHALWDVMSPDHPNYDESICRLIFARFYKKLDEKIQQIRELFSRRTDGSFVTVVISDHGFQTHFKRVNLGWWLVQQDFLRIEKKTFCQNLEQVVNQLRRKKKRKVQFSWEESRVYSFSRGNDGFIYFLEDDPELRKKTELQLRSLLESLKDPETGNAIVKQILLRDSIYQGRHVDRMPDWIVQPADGYSFTGGYLPQQKSLLQPVHRKNDFHVGMHHAEGILLACGQGIRQGMQVSGARLLDLAPTLLAWLNVTIPEAMEGRVLTELFTENLQRGCEVSSVDRRPVKEMGEVYSEEDVDKIKQRLRDLGYIE